MHNAQIRPAYSRTLSRLWFGSGLFRPPAALQQIAGGYGVVHLHLSFITDRYSTRHATHQLTRLSHARRGVHNGDRARYVPIAPPIPAHMRLAPIHRWGIDTRADAKASTRVHASKRLARMPLRSDGSMHRGQMCSEPIWDWNLCLIRGEVAVCDEGVGDAESAWIRKIRRALDAAR